MVRCRANYQALDEVLQFVKQDCCKGVALPVFGARVMREGGQSDPFFYRSNITIKLGM